jgi:hypothetical protein
LNFGQIVNKKYFINPTSENFNLCRAENIHLGRRKALENKPPSKPEPADPFNDPESYQNNQLPTCQPILPAILKRWTPSTTATATATWFPLPVDHLLTLIQFNIYRATLTNIFIVTPSAIKSPEVLEIVHISPNLLPSSVPPSLTPTILQRKVKHPAWIDAAPLAVLRDNLILAEGTYDSDALCLDVLGLFHGYEGDGRECNGAMVWGDPWEVGNWEVSEGFVGRWGWLLKGCGELMQATNYWRGRRGEEALVVDVEMLERPSEG